METPKPLPPAADKDKLEEQLNQLETQLARKVIAVGLVKTENPPEAMNVARVLDASLSTPKLKRLQVEEVPEAARADSPTFRGFIAPLLVNSELLDRTAVLLGEKETQVVVLRELPEQTIPPGDGTLRGDGTWPWFATVDGNDIVVSEAKTTAFGGADDPQDSGETASGVSTRNNPGLKGCSLPMRYTGQNEKLREALGGSPIPKMPFGLKSNGQPNPDGARVVVTHRATGKKIEVPVIDLGPAKKTGHPLDLTVAAAREFDANASARNFSMSLDFRILGGARFVDRAEIALTGVAAGSLAQKLAASAESEFALVRQTHETSPPLRQRIEKYWEEIGLHFPGVSTAWSAVFISWNVLQAGATKANFSFDQRHSKFVHDAIVGANPQPAFRGRRLTEYKPKVGDIIQNNRSGNSFDFDHASANAAYESHSAIVVEIGESPGGGGFAITIGGNENDSVRRRRNELDADGKLVQPEPRHFICILENLMA